MGSRAVSDPSYGRKPAMSSGVQGLRWALCLSLGPQNADQQLTVPLKAGHFVSFTIRSNGKGRVLFLDETCVCCCDRQTQHLSGSSGDLGLSRAVPEGCPHLPEVLHPGTHGSELRQRKKSRWRQHSRTHGTCPGVACTPAHTTGPPPWGTTRQAAPA